MIRKEGIRILGVDCATCAYAIGRNLSKLSGVRGFDLDVSSGEAIVEYDDSKNTLRDIYIAVRDAGYDVEKRAISIHLNVSPEEHAVLEEKLLRIRGVLDVGINPVANTAKIIFNERTTTSTDILRELARLGVRYSEIRGVEIKRKDVYTPHKRVAAFILGLTAITLDMSGVSHGVGGVELDALLPALSISVILLSHSTIVRGLKALASLRPTMESLIALSSTATFSAGTLFSILRFQHAIRTESLFAASAGVLGFVGLGLYLEERLRYRALAYLDELERSLRGSVRVIKNGSVVDVSINEVAVGEVIEVKAGDRALVDGVVVEGWGYVDESTFTGEPTPVLKKAESRDVVLAGSVLVSGYLKVRATRVGEDTVLSHILESARSAVFYKPGFQRVADRVVGFLTWIVLAVALSTFTVWWLITRDPILSVIFMASTLAVACPCPLGIATPLAVSMGVIVASRSGALIRRGDIFERLLKSNMVIFDKTGTLTVGRPRVANFISYGDFSHVDVLGYVCSVESYSEHPLAHAILEYCRERGVDVVHPDYYEHFPGLGVAGRVKGVDVVIGSIKLLESMNVEMPIEVLSTVSDIGKSGGTPVLVSIDGRVAGVIEVRDMLRSESPEVVEHFKRLGLKVGLASGDMEASVGFVKEKLGLDFAYASLKPTDKARVIREMQSNGMLPTYVGDGLNDAVAINAAFVGVAMSRGPDLVRESGDVVLLSNNLKTLKSLHSISKKVVRVAKENLFWAFIYNTALIPIAAGVLYPLTGLMLRPDMAALAMVLSDVSVVLNSFRLLLGRA
uniref:Metal-transporting ATPase n=1 Tax=Fervidicoccus fontis TaxID=683846 RepID=A0A7J3ZJS7_9CREN